MTHGHIVAMTNREFKILTI